MDTEHVRKVCMSLPHATESLQWGDDLVFKIGGKMFAMVVLVPTHVWLSFKCAAEEFAELTEHSGVIPAPYLARSSWVALETPDALCDEELERLLRSSYELVLAKLPRKVQAGFTQAARKAKAHHWVKSKGTRRPRHKAR